MRGEPQTLQIGTRFWFSLDSEICLHPFQYRPGDMDSLPHTHDEYNIILSLTGGASYSLRGRVETLNSADVLVINPGEVHSGNYGTQREKARGLTLHIPARTLKKILAKMRFPGDLDRSRILFLRRMNDPLL